MAWEYARFFLRLAEEVPGADSLEELMERGLCFAHGAIEAHELLQQMVRTEPERLLPTLTVESGKSVALIAGFLVPYLRPPRVRGRGRPGRGGRLRGPHGPVLHRISRSMGPDDPVQVRTLVQTELLAGILEGPEVDVETGRAIYSVSPSVDSTWSPRGWWVMDTHSSSGAAGDRGAPGGRCWRSESSA